MNEETLFFPLSVSYHLKFQTLIGKTDLRRKARVRRLLLSIFMQKTLRINKIATKTLNGRSWCQKLD